MGPNMGPTWAERGPLLLLLLLLLLLQPLLLQPLLLMLLLLLLLLLLLGKINVFHALDNLNIIKYNKSTQQQPRPPVFLQQGAFSSLPALAPHAKRSIFHALDHLNITKNYKST